MSALAPCVTGHAPAMVPIWQAFSVSSDRRPARDAGSRGMFDVLRHPVAAFSAPFREGAAPTDADTSAASGTEGRVVSCFLCAAVEGLPQRWKMGGLQLDASGIRWAPGMRLRGGGSLLPSSLQVQTVREVRGWGRERMYVKHRIFQIIEATSDRGRLQLAVPRDSVALVVNRLRADTKDW